MNFSLEWKKNKSIPGIEIVESTIYALGTIRIQKSSTEDFLIKFDFIDCSIEQQLVRGTLDNAKSAAESRLSGMLIGSFRDLQRLKKILKTDY